MTDRSTVKRSRLHAVIHMDGTVGKILTSSWHAGTQGQRYLETYGWHEEVGPRVRAWADGARALMGTDAEAKVDLFLETEVETTWIRSQQKAAGSMTA